MPGPSSGEETPISQDGMSYRVRSLPSSLFHPSNRALPSDCVARVENLVPFRVVSWAVAVRVTTHPVYSTEEGTYELLGTMTGTLQVGATVNEGEQVAINKLAEWVTTPVRSSSDSKVAIKRCLKANIHETLPQVWSTSSAQRELLQLSWTKGHLDATQHCQRTGVHPPGATPTTLCAPRSKDHFARNANVRGKKGGSGLLLRLAFPVLRVLLLYLLVEMFLPVNVSKYKAKAKSKVKIGLESVACFFRPANGSRSDG